MMRGVTRRTWLEKVTACGGGIVIPLLREPAGCFAQGAEAQIPPTESEAATMTETVRRFMDRYQVPGLSVAIARHGQSVYEEGFGLADKESAERVTPSRLFRIASVSKPITSATVYSLLEKGPLKLGDLVFAASGGHLEAEYGAIAGEFEKQMYPATNCSRIPAVDGRTTGRIPCFFSPGWTTRS